MAGEKVRLQLNLGPTVVTDLDEIKDALGITARTDVVKYALAFLQWAVRARRDGYTILAERDEEQRVVVLSFSIGSGANASGQPADAPGEEKK